MSLFQGSWTVSAMALLVAASAAIGIAEEPIPSKLSELEAAKRRLAGSETYDLKYKLAQGDTVRYLSEHLATVDTRIKGTSQVAKTRSISTKAWQVKSVDAAGQITFVHSVENVDMWQQVDGREEIRFNSATDKTPPAEYELVAKLLGKPLAEVTVDARGRLVARKNLLPQFTHGEGQLTIALPPQPVKVGEVWDYPNDIQVRLPKGGGIQTLKARTRYRLERVEGSIAVIGAQTQVLTPVEDPALKAQIIQRLMHGQIRFDMNAGRVVSQEMNQDESVVAFSGADSRMQYLARFTETLITGPAPNVATRPAGPERR